MIVVATWPNFLSLEARLGQRRLLAIALMTLGMLLLLVLPLWLAVDTIVGNADALTAAADYLIANGLPPLPAWISGLPLIGGPLAGLWAQLAAGGADGIIAQVTPYAADTGKWALAQVGGLGGMLVQFLLIVTIAARRDSGRSRLRTRSAGSFTSSAPMSCRAVLSRLRWDLLGPSDSASSSGFSRSINGSIRRMRAIS
jgi:predicted PurR-regulated permease PerM